MSVAPPITELSSEDMEGEDLDEHEESLMKRDVSTHTDMDLIEMEELVMLQNKVLNLEKKLEEAKFSLSNIKDEESKVIFYSGFPSFLTLKAFYNFLGSAADNLKYSKKQEESDIQSGAESKRLR